MTRYEPDFVERSNGSFLLRDSVIEIIKKKITSIKESNTYRGKISQRASEAVYFLEDVLKEIEA